MKKVALAVLVGAIGVVLPSNKLSPPPAAIRIGPVQYDSAISPPQTFPLGSSSETEPTDFVLKLDFKIESRPTDYAYLLSTSRGVGRGLKVSLDLYGNLFLSIEQSGNVTGDYQLIKLSGPLDFGVRNSVIIHFEQLRGQLSATHNGKTVQVTEARPLRYLDMSAMVPTTDYIEIGGSDGHNLIGQINRLELTFGRADVTIDGINIKILLVLLAIGLLLSSLKPNTKATRLPDDSVFEES